MSPLVFRFQDGKTVPAPSRSAPSGNPGHPGVPALCLLGPCGVGEDNAAADRGAHRHRAVDVQTHRASKMDVGLAETGFVTVAAAQVLLVDNSNLERID